MGKERVHAFPKGRNPNMNLIQLKFELTPTPWQFSLETNGKIMNH